MKSTREPREEIARLRERLAEAEETLRAIRAGEVDAVIVNGPKGDQIFTLEAAERPYRMLVEEMQQGALTMGPDGTILYCNRALASMLRVEREKLIFTSIFNALSDWDRSAFEALVREGMSGAMVRDEFTLVASDGTQVPVFISANLLPNEEVSTLCLVVNDLTMRKQQEAMKAAKEASEQANRAKDQFLAALSHELRTPLTPVLLAATELVKRGELSPDVRDEVEMIRRNIELESRLIDDLLDLTRVSRGKMELTLRPTDAHQMIRSALSICEPDVRTKQQQVTLALNARACVVKGDPARLHQIYWNLVKNAVKFTPVGGRIVVRSHCDDRGWLVTEVVDSGIGIDNEVLPKLFNAFEQGDPSVTRRFGGLGMGLSISKALVDLHGGIIAARSEGKNKGATFTVAFPTVQAEASEVIGGRPTPNLARLGPLRVLLVEDHPDTARSMSRLLRELGYRVKTATSVGEAITAAEGEEIDLLISDVGLPDGTGHDVVRHLRETRGAIKAIALSGYGMELDIRRSLEAGFMTHLVKPIKFDELQQAIARLVHGGKPKPPTGVAAEGDGRGQTRVERGADGRRVLHILPDQIPSDGNGHGNGNRDVSGNRDGSGSGDGNDNGDGRSAGRRSGENGFKRAPGLSGGDHDTPSFLH